MKKKVACLSFVLFSLLSDPIGAQQFGAGVVMGFNASQVDGDDLAGYHKLGLHLGLKSAVYLSDKLDLNIEFLYSERGSINPDGPEKLKLQYIELPVLITFMDWLSDDELYYRLHFHGGISIGRLFQTTLVDQSGFLEQYNDLLAKNDLSAVVGFTYKINRHWGAGARYTGSFTKLSKGDGTDLLPDLRGYFLNFRVEYTIL